MATELTSVGANPATGSSNPSINIHQDNGNDNHHHNAVNHSNTASASSALAPPPAVAPAIDTQNVAVHFDDQSAHHDRLFAHSTPNPSPTGTASLGPAPIPQPAAALLPGSGGNEEDFLARFRAEEKVDEKRIDVAKPKRTIDPETMARLNARAGIYSGGYEQLLALRAKPNKGDATLRDIRALEELHANTIRKLEGGGGSTAPAAAPESLALMVGGGQQLLSIIHDGHEISVEEMGRVIADHKEATDTMRARMVAAKKGAIPSFAPPTPHETVPKKSPHDIVGDEKPDWHNYPDEELWKRLESSPEKGLDTATLLKKQQEFGPNLLTPPPTIPFWLKTLINLVGGFQLMLWGGAALSFIVYGLSKGEDTQTLVLALVLILVVLLSTAFQMFQEGKSDGVMASLKALTPATCTVIRNGKQSIEAASTLVPGDIVKVTAGDKVPADMRILSSHDLKVNNSALTGEPDDIKLGADPKAQVITEARNIARTGCAFTFGDGTGVVFATGDRTLFGTIARATTGTKRPDSLMKKEIQRLIHIMACIAFTLGIIFLILALFNGYEAVDAVIFMIGIIVANVPEGLLPQMTVALTLTAQRMRDKNVLVSNLEIIETLGATTVICSDKTGTLTCNRMTVSHLYYDNQIFRTELTPPGDDFKEFDPKHPVFVALQRSMTLNTNATWLTKEEVDPKRSRTEARDAILKRSTKGDASETALIKFVENYRPIEEYRAACPRKFLIPFNSVNKWAASINQLEDQNAPLYLLLKGAPDVVLNKCSNVLRLVNDVPTLVPMDADRRREFEAANLNLCRRGERVLALCELALDPTKCNASTPFEYDRDEPEKTNFPLDGLTFVGLVSLIDPPRATVPASVKECYAAGIQVFMVTGDHPETAHAIAKSIGLVTTQTKEEIIEAQEEAKQQLAAAGKPTDVDEKGQAWPAHDSIKGGAYVVHGQKLAEFKDDDWEYMFSHKEVVFARTQPIQKQTIVNKLKARGHIVAMTGDGVNDAPALKAANAGLAMGSGTTVAKEAASIILMDDNFSSIVEGVREGRLIFVNLKKCIAYVLSSNIPELLPFLFFIAAKVPLGLETIMILLVDVGTDLAPAVSLAYEEPEAAIMQMPPRNQKTDHIVGAKLMFVAYIMMGCLETFAAFFAFFWVFADFGLPFSSLFGAGPNYRDHYDCSQANSDCKEMDNDRRLWFDGLCRDASPYGGYRRQGLGPITAQAQFGGGQYWCPAPSFDSATGIWTWTANDLAVGEDFRDYLQEVLGHAQTAFLMTVVWIQISNLLMRKTMKASLWDFGVRSNRPLLYCILSMIILMVLLVYVPGLNEALFLRPISTKHACVGLWMFPTMIIWEEIRKYFIRRWPDGLVSKASYF